MVELAKGFQKKSHSARRLILATIMKLATGPHWFDGSRLYILQFTDVANSSLNDGIIALDYLTMLGSDVFYLMAIYLIFYYR